MLYCYLITWQDTVLKNIRVHFLIFASIMEYNGAYIYVGKVKKKCTYYKIV